MIITIYSLLGWHINSQKWGRPQLFTLCMLFLWINIYFWDWILLPAIDNLLCNGQCGNICSRNILSGFIVAFWFTGMEGIETYLLGGNGQLATKPGMVNWRPKDQIQIVGEGHNSLLKCESVFPLNRSHFNPRNDAFIYFCLIHFFLYSF